MSLYIKFSFSMYVSFVSVTYIKSGGWRLRWRRALSSIKKGVFLDVEGHVLEWRRACSWMGKDMFLKGVRQGGEASVAVRFCEIGWLNVSVGLCVFCSSVYSVRNRTHPLYEITHKQHAGEFFLSQSAQSSRRFLAHISSPQNAFGIQSSQSVTAKDGCKVLWNRLT